jgi:hypothetical protein
MTVTRDALKISAALGGSVRSKSFAIVGVDDLRIDQSRLARGRVVRTLAFDADGRKVRMHSHFSARDAEQVLGELKRAMARSSGKTRGRPS